MSSEEVFIYSCGAWWAHSALCVQGLDAVCVAQILSVRLGTSESSSSTSISSFLTDILEAFLCSPRIAARSDRSMVSLYTWVYPYCAQRTHGPV